jgi:hypothetical protein
MELPPDPILSRLDVVRSLIASGEGHNVEFKASLRYDLQTHLVNRELPKVVAKTVAGFLNGGGGTLLIGVSDDGRVLGLESDLSTLSTKNRDGFERALRTALDLHLGVLIGPRLAVAFVDLDGSTVAQVTCPPHDSPVFFRDGDRQEFYIRDGNQTKPIGVRDMHEYVRARWPTEPAVTRESVRAILSEVLHEPLAPVQGHALRPTIQQAVRAVSLPTAVTKTTGEVHVPWLKVSTRRVLDLFLSSLAYSPGWKRLYLISPWISDIVHAASLTSDQFCKRAQADNTTIYVVTRPPEEPWHKQALERLGDTGRVNMAVVPDLHIKLYTALTRQTSFAMLGSANFTQQSLLGREIGLRIDAYSDGRKLVSQLHYEANQVYRIPGRRLLYKASFSPN